jgi:hypothetical protein
MVVVAFYAALHAVDTLLAHDQVRGIVSHQARNEVLARTNRYAAIWRAYHPLYSLSRTVRYLANPQDWISADDVTSKLHVRYLYPIEKSVQRRLGDEVDLPPVAARLLPE